VVNINQYNDGNNTISELKLELEKLADDLKDDLP